MATKKDPAQKITRRAPRKTSAPKIASAASTDSFPAAAPTHDDIARRAYERFQARGCIHGFHVEDWLAAEAELGR